MSKKIESFIGGFAVVCLVVFGIAVAVQQSGILDPYAVGVSSSDQDRTNINVAVPEGRNFDSSALIGATKTAVFTITPENASSKKVIWNFGDENKYIDSTTSETAYFLSASSDGINWGILGNVESGVSLQVRLNYAVNFPSAGIRLYGKANANENVGVYVKFTQLNLASSFELWGYCVTQSESDTYLGVSDSANGVIRFQNSANEYYEIKKRADNVFTDASLFVKDGVAYSASGSSFWAVLKAVGVNSSARVQKDDGTDFKTYEGYVGYEVLFITNAGTDASGSLTQNGITANWSSKQYVAPQSLIGDGGGNYGLHF